MNGKQITKAREKLNLSVEELAVKVGVTIKTIYRWEKNKGDKKMHKVFEKKLKQVLQIQEK
jgi:transcriptional regulator with XRE-family HTH domain